MCQAHGTYSNIMSELPGVMWTPFFFQQCKRFCMLDSIMSDCNCFLPLFLDNDKLRWCITPVSHLDPSNHCVSSPIHPCFPSCSIQTNQLRDGQHPCNMNDNTSECFVKIFLGVELEIMKEFLAESVCVDMVFQQYENATRRCDCPSACTQV